MCITRAVKLDPTVRMHLTTQQKGRGYACFCNAGDLTLNYKINIFFFLCGLDKPRGECLTRWPNRNSGRTYINVKKAVSSLKRSFNLKTVNCLARMLPPKHKEVAYQVNIRAVSG